jgi:outer membrane cobalamin receptor
LHLGDYHLLNFGVTQQIPGTKAEAFVRLENMLDQNYVDNYGFEQSGRTLFLGGRVKF